MIITNSQDLNEQEFKKNFVEALGQNKIKLELLNRKISFYTWNVT